MTREHRVLIIAKEGELAAIVEQWAEANQARIGVQCLQSAALAVARVACGDVSAVVLDPGTFPDSEWPRLIEELRSIRSRARLIVAALSVSGPISVPRDVAVSKTALSLCTQLTKVFGERLQRSAIDAGTRKTRDQEARTVGFFGAKGGVGTTTIALNTACVLAETQRTGLIEAGSAIHTAGLRLGTHRVANTRHGADSAGPGLGATIKDFPLLRILEASDTDENEAGVPENNLADVLERLGSWAECVVIDLGSAITKAVRDTIPWLDEVSIVFDRNLLSAECAKRCASALSSAGLKFAPGGIIVDRSALGYPPEVHTLEAVSGLSVLGVVPPASDLSCATDNAGQFLIRRDPNSIAAQELRSLARHFDVNQHRRSLV